MGRHPFLLRRQTELLLAELNAAPSAGNAYADLEFRDKLVRDVGKDAFSGRKAAVAADAAVNIPVAAKTVSDSTPFSRNTFSISRSTIEVLTFGFGLPFSISTFIFFVVTSPVQPVSAKKSGIKSAQMTAHTALFSLHHKAPFRHCK